MGGLMKLYPEYRRTDGRRTPLGDRLLNHFPVIVKYPRGYALSLVGVRMKAVYVKRDLIRKSPWCGLRIGKHIIARKSWGMSRVYFWAFGWVIGRG